MMTFNDYVIPSVILLLMDVNGRLSPFDSEIVEGMNFTSIGTALEKAINFLIDSQIVVDGTPTLWGNNTIQRLLSRFLVDLGNCHAEPQMSPL